MTVRVYPNGSGASIMSSGTWLPQLWFGGVHSVGVVYTVQTGTWIKIDRLVFISGRITVSNKGASVGQAWIANLPFAHLGGNAGYGGVVFPFYNAMAGLTHFGGYGNQGTNFIVLTNGGAVVTAGITDANFTNTSDIVFTMSYPTVYPGAY